MGKVRLFEWKCNWVTLIKRRVTFYLMKIGNLFISFSSFYTSKFSRSFFPTFLSYSLYFKLSQSLLCFEFSLFSYFLQNLSFGSSLIFSTDLTTFSKFQLLESLFFKFSRMSHVENSLKPR